MKSLKFAKAGYYLVSVLFYAIGITFLLRREVNLDTATGAAGVLLIFYGVTKIVGYLSKDLYCLAFQYDLAGGVLLVVLGVFDLVFRERISEYLYVGSGLLVLLDSLLCIQTSIDTKRFGLEAWKGILALSILAGALGVIAVAVGTQVPAGLALLGEGAMRHYLTHAAVGPLQSKEPK